MTDRPPHPVPRSARAGTYCEDYEENGCAVDVCPTGCYHAPRAKPDDDGLCVCGQPRAAPNTHYCYDCLEASEHEDKDGL